MSQLDTPMNMRLAMIVAIIASLAVTPRQGAAHDIYNHWNIPGSSRSCCNQMDCKPTRAKYENGSWWAFVASRAIRVKIPDQALVQYKTEDTDAHLCFQESTSQVLCFRPPVQGM